MDIAVRKLMEWKQSPLLFVTECIGAVPSTQQVELLQAFGDSSTKRISVRSGHGTGKDACASWVIAWFLTLHRNSKVVCTAPTGRQLSDILWSEISKWFRKSAMLADEFEIQADKIFHKSAPKEWWCRAVSASVRATKEEQAETLAGFHGDDLLFIVDESSGVPDPVFIPLEGALTQENNRILLIGNMTRNKGYFYDSHFHVSIKQDWCKLVWNSEESTNVKTDYPKYMANKYGVDSDVYRIRVLGEPPKEDDESFIPLSWAQQCIGNDIGEPSDNLPIYIGVDVARFGGDSSVVLPRQGNHIGIWDEYHKRDTVDVAGFVSQSYIDNEAEGCAIEENGIGGAVYDILRRRNMPGLMAIDVARSSTDPKKWDRVRDEGWGLVKEKCRAGLYSFPAAPVPAEGAYGVKETYGDRLANELATPRYGFTNNQAIKVESKKDMRARGIASPNIADALIQSELLYFVSNRLFASPNQKKKKVRNSRQPMPDDAGYGSGSQLWMAQ